MHNPEIVLENETHTIFWGGAIEIDHLISARRPDLVMVYEKKRFCRIDDIAVPVDQRVKLKGREKRNTYLDWRIKRKNYGTRR